MSSVDNRIVEMKFDNASFQQGVSTTLSALGKLKEGLKFTGASKGLNDVQGAASRFSLNGVEGSITHVSKSFLALSTVGITALSNLTSKAISAGTAFAKSFTAQPLIDGYHEYETNLNSIQTILANTKASGATLKDVNGALAQLNTYSDKTIYNFSEMARNIGTFTAAGVDLQTSVNSIKGIANLAALSGSNSQQASTAMYQLSQAIAAGRVSLQDWNSVVNAGMGGATFQRALAQTAESMGTLGNGAVKLSGKMKNVTINGKSFRESITAKPGEQSWLTSKVLTNTLQQFTGDLSKAQLKAQGFNDAQIKAIQATAKNAQNAATKVKSVSQLIDVARETAGSGWTKTWQLVFGNFKEARSSFTEASNTVNKFINGMSNARNQLLKSWSDMGGRTVAIDAIKNAFKALGTILKPIHDAFREIFPPTTGRQLYDLTVSIRDFMKNLAIGKDTADNLKRTFAGLFAVLDIGKQIVMGIFSVIGDLFGAVGEGSGGILNFTGNVGDFLVSLDKAIKMGGAFTGFFHALGAVLSAPIKLIGALGDGLSHLSDHFDPAFLDKISAAFHSVGEAIADVFSAQNSSVALQGLSAGLLGGIFLVVKQFIGKLSTIFDGGLFGGGGLLDSIKDTFQTLTGSLKAMQTEIQARTLLLIAGALALLTASVVALSFVDGKKLGKSLAALTVAFTQLLGAMAVLVKISGSAGFLKVPLIAASMVLLSSSILILTAAVAAMGQLDWVTIGKGLTGIAGALVVIGGAMKLMPKGMVLQAASLVLIGAALNEIALAIAGLGQLDWTSVGKGLTAIAGALLIIAGAMQLMPATLPLTAAGLVLVGIALNGIALAVAGMAQLGWEEIAKGLVALGGSLLILAGGLTLMSGTLGGSASLLVAANALAILAPVIAGLGQLSWEAIAKGLITIAGAFAVLGGASLILAPVIPAMLGLGVALLAVGAGLALAGAAALAFSAAFTAVVGVGTAGIAIMGKMLDVFIKALPAAIKAFGQGVVEFAKVIGKGGAAFTKAMTTVLTSLLNAIIKVTPKIGQAFMVLLNTALKVLVAGIPKMVDAGMKILLGVLNGINNNIGKMIPVGASIVVKFLNGLSNQLPKIINAGVNLIVKFINGVSKAINAHASELGAAGGHLAVAIVEGMAKGIASGAGSIASAAVNVAKGALHSAMGFLHINSPSRVFRDQVGKPISEGMAVGVTAGAPWVALATVDVLRKARDAAKVNIPAAFEDLGKFMNKSLVKGLIGSEAEVRDTLKTMNDDINEALAKSRANVAQDRDHLKDLLKAKNQDAEAITKARKTLADAEAIEARAQKAHDVWKKHLDDERQQLIALGKQYDQNVEDIKDQQKALQDAKDALANEASSVTSQYSSLPDITDTTTVADYTAAIQAQADQTQTFLNSLNQLANMGLDDETYQKLLSQGVGVQPFVDQLIAAGPESVKALNAADKNLKTAATTLGNDAAEHLYQAGVDAAQGLLNGLKSKKAAIRKEMEDIATMIDNTMRKKLGIKSPSRVLMEVGRYAGEGLALGLSRYSSIVSDSASGLADEAVSAIQDTVSKITDAVNGGIDATPVIAPVLDLTKLRKDAASMGAIIGSSTINAGVSLNQASTISNGTQKVSTPTDAAATAPASPVIQFEQNNYSPKALSAVEIYRQTKNQISLAKEALSA